MHLANYLGYLHKAELHLAEAYRKVGEGHAEEADVYHACNTLAEQCEAHAGKLGPFVERYGEAAPAEPDRLYHELFDETRSGGLGLLRDMQDLYLMANACDISWTMIGQAAQGLSDRDLLEVVDSCEGQTTTQIKWLKTRMKQAAPQALLVASLWRRASATAFTSGSSTGPPGYPCSCRRPRVEPDAGKRASDVVLGFAGRRPPFAAHGGYGSSRSRRRTRDGRVLGNGGRIPAADRRGDRFCGDRVRRSGYDLPLRPDAARPQ